MENSSYWQKRLEAKNFYSSMEDIKCPSLDEEIVVFNVKGFAHLIRKGRALRSEIDQIRRFSLLVYVALVVSDSNTNLEYRKEKTAEFWTLSKKIGGRTIKVTIRQLSGGRKHFFSVMDKS